MSEPLNTGIKRIIWIASDKRYHSVIDVWSDRLSLYTLSEWKKFYRSDYYITKHEVWL